MKLKRYKRIRKILHSYQITHSIKPPYKVCLDGEFIQAALAGQIMLKEQMPKMLQEERTTVYVTPCIDNWLRLKGAPYSGALHIATKLDHLKCRHEKGFVRPFECIKHLVANGNPDRLLIGAQDEPIRKLIRHVPGTPLLLIHGSTMIMESPTDSTKEDHEQSLAARQKIEKIERKKVAQAERELKAEATDTVTASSYAVVGTHGKPKHTLSSSSKKKAKKGPSQPNPLSVKKKKSKLPTPPNPNKSKSEIHGNSSNEPPRKKLKSNDGQSKPSNESQETNTNRKQSNTQTTENAGGTVSGKKRPRDEHED